MRARAMKIALILLALLVGAAFAAGRDDHPCTGGDNECTGCTCESGSDGCTCDETACEDRTGKTGCDDCASDSVTRAGETSAPIGDDSGAEGCQGCPGHGCNQEGAGGSPQ